MKKADKIKQYNASNPSYNITDIKKVDDITWQRNEYKSLMDLYANPSYAKRASWHAILADYNPKEIIGMSGNSMMYSVWLVAGNGDVLHITRANNYLVEVTGE